MLCPKCDLYCEKEDLKLKCKICEKWFHKQCVGINLDKYRLITTKREHWTCGNCKETKFVLEDLKQSIHEVENQNGFLLNRIGLIEQENNLLRLEIDYLKLDGIQRQRDLENFRKELALAEKQRFLDDYVIFTGHTLYRRSKEELTKDFLDVAAHQIGVEIQESDIESTIVGRKNAEVLRIKFKDRKLKQKLMIEKRSRALFHEAVPNDGYNMVFINHDLTPDNQSLFKRTRLVKRQLNYKFAWVGHGGKIYLRKTNSSEKIHVTCDDFLTQLINAESLIHDEMPLFTL